MKRSRQVNLMLNEVVWSLLLPFASFQPFDASSGLWGYHQSIKANLAANLCVRGSSCWSANVHRSLRALTPSV